MTVAPDTSWVKTVTDWPADLVLMGWISDGTLQKGRLGRVATTVILTMMGSTMQSKVSCYLELRRKTSLAAAVTLNSLADLAHNEQIFLVEEE